MTPAPENRSRTGEEVAALAFRSLSPGPDHALSVSRVSSWSASVAYPAPSRGRAVRHPGAAAQQRHLREAVPDPHQRSWGRLLGGVTAHADPDRPQVVNPPHRRNDVDGWGVRPEHSPSDPTTSVNSVIGSPCTSPADPPIIVVAVGAPILGRTAVSSRSTWVCRDGWTR
jgi:hypothetical protein